MRALLDISVILALIDFDHVFHKLAHEWWDSAKKLGWASCPLTENGVVRIMTQPHYGQPDSYSAKDVTSWLTEFAGDSDHEFWADDISILNPKYFDPSLLHGPKQITDMYLLGLATSKGGRLATFDQRIASAAVHGASESNLLVIA